MWASDGEAQHSRPQLCPAPRVLSPRLPHLPCHRAGELLDLQGQPCTELLCCDSFPGDTMWPRKPQQRRLRVCVWGGGAL